MREIASTLKDGHPNEDGSRRQVAFVSPLTRSPWENFKRFFWKYKFFHLLVLPGVAYYVVFHYLPMVGLIVAFNDYTGMGGVKGIITAPWVGLKNFVDLFHSLFFWRLLRNSLILSGLRLLF